MRRYIAFLLGLLLALSLILPGCKGENELNGNGISLYYKEAQKNNLKIVKGTFDQGAGFEERIFAIYNHLKETGESSSYVSPISADVTLKNISLTDTNLVFNFDASYHKQSSVNEVLMRAALVKTFTQLENVVTVEIHVEDQPLVLKDGTVVSAQKSTDFIDLFGNGLNEYTEAEVTVYFATTAGDSLVRTTKTINYANRLSLEQAVLGVLMQGPEDGEGISAFPNSLKVTSVNTQNGVCYVNFSQSLLQSVFTVLPEVFIYSLVDSLTEISSITSVQISVDGSSNVTFMDTISFEKPFYRNLDYVTQVQEIPPETEGEEAPKEAVQ